MIYTNISIDNVIIIKPWYSDENDQELSKYMKLLQENYNEGGDIRYFIRNYKMNLISSSSWNEALKAKNNNKNKKRNKMNWN